MTTPRHSAYIICYANEDHSDWEIVDGDDAIQERVGKLEELGYTTILVFPESAEIDFGPGEL